MEFPRQECWSELPFPTPGDLPDPEIEPVSPALAGRFFTTAPPGKSWYSSYCYLVTKSCPLFETRWTTGCQASLTFCISLSLLKCMSIEPVIPFNHLIFCCPFPSCLQSFPASRSFPRSQLFASGGQSIGASSSASVFSMNSQSWFFFKIDKDIFISSWDMLISLILLVNILVYTKDKVLGIRDIL